MADGPGAPHQIARFASKAVSSAKRASKNANFTNGKQAFQSFLDKFPYLRPLAMPMAEDGLQRHFWIILDRIKAAHERVGFLWPFVTIKPRASGRPEIRTAGKAD